MTAKLKVIIRLRSDTWFCFREEAMEMEDPVREAIDLIGLDGSKGREREKRDLQKKGRRRARRV